MALIDPEEVFESEFDTPSGQNNNELDDAPIVAEKPKIPDKYSGKSLEDIVTMHQEAEKLIGRQAQEVGEVRKLADELIKQQLYPKQSKDADTQVEDNQEIDFFEDPKKAVRQAVDNHPDVLAAKQATREMKQMQTQALLQKKHPDFAEVTRDNEFIEWVKGSPLRLNMYAQADSNYDFQSADELLTTFKQIRGTRSNQAKEEGNQTLKKNLQAASVDVGGTGETSQKVYRRADLIRLRMTDPRRYEALSDDIMQAYVDGRVK